MPPLIYYVRTFHASIYLSSCHSCERLYPHLCNWRVKFQKSQVTENHIGSLYGDCQFNFRVLSELCTQTCPNHWRSKRQNWLKDNRIVLSIFGIKKLLLRLVAARNCWLQEYVDSYITEEITPWIKKCREYFCQISFSRASHNQVPFFTVFCNPTNWDHPKCYHELMSTSIKNPIYIPYENTWPSKVFDFHWTFSSVCHLKFRPLSIFLSNAASHGSLANELAK